MIDEFYSLWEKNENPHVFRNKIKRKYENSVHNNLLIMIIIIMISQKNWKNWRGRKRRRSSDLAPSIKSTEHRERSNGAIHILYDTF